MAELDALIGDLSNLVAKYPNVTGPQFVAACERVAAGYYDDLPVFDVDAFFTALRDGLNGDVAQAE